MDTLPIHTTLLAISAQVHASSVLESQRSALDAFPQPLTPNTTTTVIVAVSVQVEHLRLDITVLSATQQYHFVQLVMDQPQIAPHVRLESSYLNLVMVAARPAVQVLVLILCPIWLIMSAWLLVRVTWCW